MPVSQTIRDADPVLADKLDAMETACFDYDDAELSMPIPDPFFIPSLPFFLSLLGSIEGWWGSDRTVNKNKIADMYRNVVLVLNLRPTFEKYMIDSGVGIPQAYIDSYEQLETVSGASYDTVFNASGFWTVLKGRGSSYYANPTAEDLVDDDITDYLTGYVAQEVANTENEEQDRKSVV